jgi:hypothetical protein
LAGQLKRRSLNRQQHQGKGGTRKEQAGNFHDSIHQLGNTIIDNAKLPDWFHLGLWLRVDTILQK